MMFSAGEKIVIVAALQFCAMAHDKMSKEALAKHQQVDALKWAAMSSECFRLAELLAKAR